MLVLHLLYANMPTTVMQGSLPTGYQRQVVGTPIVRHCARNVTDIERNASRYISDTYAFKPPFKDSIKPPWPRGPVLAEECGKAIIFSPSGATQRDVMPDLEAFASALFKTRRLDLIDDVANAIQEVDLNGEMNATKYCEAFSSCNSKDMQLISRHSHVYFPCPSHRWFVASDVLNSFKYKSPPGRLKHERDECVFCKLAEYARLGVERQVLPQMGMTGVHCVVHELFVNEQLAGAWTVPHVHADDFFGAVFYVDAPPPTILCFANKDDLLGHKAKWERNAPILTKDLGVDRGYIAAEAGDLILFPVGYVRHWVPPIRGDGVVRTVVVMNMVCL